MTRIIAGFAGSLTLAVPGTGTRPTSDRVREAIFSSLDARGLLADARVLDLYAGSGALGLEAASRGAASVTLVEKGQQAARACSANAKKVRSSAPEARAPSVDVVARAVRTYLAGASAVFDLVFLDPPYDLGEGDVSLDLLHLMPLLAPDATVMLERSSRSPRPELPAGLRLDGRKDYGDTSLWWLGTD